LELLVKILLCRPTLGVFAGLGLITCVAACGNDDGKGKITGPQLGADGDGGAIDLNGVWVTTDFECRNAKRRETVRFDVFETEITATKIDRDDCVPSGYVTFEGKRPKPDLTAADLPVTFSFKLYEGEAGDPSSIAIVDSGTARIVTPNSIVLALSTTQLRFTRSAAAESGTSGGGGGAGGSSMSVARGGAGGTTSGRGLQTDGGGAGGDRSGAGRGSAGPMTGVCSPCEAGATCTPTADSAFCVAGAFTVLRAPGEACTADEECYGGGCLQSVCRAWCRDSSECSETGDTCEKGNGYYVGPGVEVGLCVPGI
jgi:hypothetical protein